MQAGPCLRFPSPRALHAPRCPGSALLGHRRFSDGAEPPRAVPFAFRSRGAGRPPPSSLVAPTLVSYAGAEDLQQRREGKMRRRATVIGPILLGLSVLGGCAGTQSTGTQSVWDRAVWDRAVWK